MTGRIGIDDGDFDPADFPFLAESLKQEFVFGVEGARFQVQIPDEVQAVHPVAALRVADFLSGHDGERQGGGEVGEPPVPGHFGALLSAVTDDKVVGSGCRGGDEGGDSLRVMLAVGVHSQRPFEAFELRQFEAADQRRAFTLIGQVPDKLESLRIKPFGAAVGGAIVHNDSIGGGKILQGSVQQMPQSFPFVVNRDNQGCFHPAQSDKFVVITLYFSDYGGNYQVSAGRGAPPFRLNCVILRWRQRRR